MAGDRMRKWYRKDAYSLGESSKAGTQPAPSFCLKVNTERKVRRRVRAQGWRAVKDKEGRLPSEEGGDDVGEGARRRQPTLLLIPPVICGG